jgi:hypothetical protein
MTLLLLLLLLLLAPPALWMGDLLARRAVELMIDSFEGLDHDDKCFILHFHDNISRMLGSKMLQQIDALD